jgi:branched-chain amino acid transport system substrate-binding protein
VARRTIAGEKLKVIVLDDATDPTNGVKNAKRFVTEDKADIIMGSVATPVAIPMAGGRRSRNAATGALAHAALPAWQGQLDCSACRSPTP